VNELGEAFILATPDEAHRRVASVPYLLRTVLSLQRAGIGRCTVVGGGLVPADERVRCQIAYAPELALPDDGTSRLVVDHGAVIDTALVAGLRRAALAGEAVEVSRGRAHVRVTNGRGTNHRKAVGLPPLMGTLRHLDDPPDEVETALLEGLGNHRDGYLDRVVHRRLSRPLTRLLLRRSWSPNAVTGAGIAIGVVGGLALGLAWPLGALLAVTLLAVSSVLDCCDGELARIRFAESRLGHVLDVTGDTAVHAALFAGIAMTLARSGTLPSIATLAALGTGVLAAFAAITWSEVNEERRHRVRGWENRVLDGVLSPISTRDWYVFPLLFALAGRLDLLVGAAAVGAHVFWVTVTALVTRVLARAPA
jgi:phosphatidylglycerophosphate synthase